MELPQFRPYNVAQACSNSTDQTDPMPSSQVEYLKTQDFLQPLERVGTTRACADPSTASSSDLNSLQVQNQHLLPGGIGTYTISHIPSYLYTHHQRVPKPEVSPVFSVVDENSNSNCSSGFTLWDESAAKRVKPTRKGSVQERTNIIDAAAAMGQWQVEQRNSFSSRSSPQTSDLKSQRRSFMDMMRSAKGSSQEGDLDDEDEEFIMKKDNNTCPRVDFGKGHGNAQKPNTPRSKHSATEQRRRSKINDRFQMLRQFIPNSDQKRDKASFLLEVIEYIHFLQEKVNKQEVVPHQEKLMKLRNHDHQPERTVPVLPDAQEVEMDQNREMEMAPFPVLGQRNIFLSNHATKLGTVSSEVAKESEKVRVEEEKEELSVHKGTISISSVYSQGLLKTLTETLESSGVDLSKATISVQIKLSKQPYNRMKKFI